MESRRASVSRPTPIADEDIGDHPRVRVRTADGGPASGE
jgi:hypothetical protein